MAAVAVRRGAPEDEDEAEAALLAHLASPSGVPSSSHRVPTVRVAGSDEAIPLCMRFMANACPCEYGAGEPVDATRSDGVVCKYVHCKYEDRPPCDHFERFGFCRKGAACHYPHRTRPVRLGGPLVLTCDAKFAVRVASRASRLCCALTPQEGRSRLLGFARAGFERKAQVALFFGPRDPEVPADFAALATAVFADADVGLVVRQIFRVDATALDDGPSLYATLRRLLAGAPSFRLQCFPPRCLDGIPDLAPLTAPKPSPSPLSSASPGVVVDVVRAGGAFYAGVRVLGDPRGPRLPCGTPLPLLPTGALLLPWADVGSRRRTTHAVSRAFFKLDEAIRTDAELGAGLRAAARERGIAIDLGAAPGGWTQRAAIEGLAVLAIDPGDMHQALVLDGEERGWVGRGAVEGPIAHLRRKAEDSDAFVNAVAAALASLKQKRGVVNGEERGEEPGVMLLMSDANAHPAAAAGWVVRLASSPSVCGVGAHDVWCVMSLKSFCGSRFRWRESVRGVEAALRVAGFSSVRTHHLFANASDELTLVAVKRKEKHR